MRWVDAGWVATEILVEGGGALHDMLGLFSPSDCTVNRLSTYMLCRLSQRSTKLPDQNVRRSRLGTSPIRDLGTHCVRSQDRRRPNIRRSSQLGTERATADQIRQEGTCWQYRHRRRKQ